MNILFKPSTVYIVAAFLSLILSFYVGMRVDVINPDAICYLQSASAMSEGLHFAMNLCGQAKWPFYSVLIFSLAKLTHLGFTESAYLLNSVFSMVSVLAFIAIVQCLINPVSSPTPFSKRALTKYPFEKGVGVLSVFLRRITPGDLYTGGILWLAAFVILFAHEFNVLRQDVIRDHGFMAFYLLSILFLLNYFRLPQWRSAWGWSISLMVATLFRIEGAVFILLLPCLVLLDRRWTFSSRIKAFLQLQSLTIFYVIVLVVWLLTHPSQNLSRLNELHFQLLHVWQIIWQNFLTRAHLVAKYILTADSVRDAYAVYLLTLLSWYVVQVITALSLIYALFVVYAWWKRVLPADLAARSVLWGYVIINLVITLFFLAEHMFLSKRYLMPLSLVLMLWVPFALNHLFLQWRERKWLPLTVLVLIVLLSVSGICRFGYSKAYIRQAGEWISQNIPKEAKLYSNDYQLKYYSNHFGNTIFQKDKRSNGQIVKWQQFDYLALRISKHDDELSQWVQQKLLISPIKVFANRRGDEVVIYKVGVSH